MNHHPDLAISWNEVTVTITTHSEGGLTANDFELARHAELLRGLAPRQPSANERRRTSSK